MLVCGIDIGTTNLKVALFDGDGRLVWIRTEPTPRTRDALGPVTDAAALLRLIETMIGQGWTELGRRAPLAAIATAGVGEDGLYVDATLEPLGPVLPWFDLRAQAEAEELAAGAAATLRAGIAMEPTRTAPKWLWTARHQPERVAVAKSWLCLTDYPLARWAGTPFMSDTLASRTGCYDAGTGEWIAPLLRASAAPSLPPVVSAGSVIGTVQSAELRQSGVTDDRTLLVAGGHDHPVAAHAIHRLAPEARVDSMGTANVVYGDAPRFEVTGFDPLISFMASIEGPAKIACLGVFEFTAAVRRFPGGMDAVRKVLALSEMPGAPSVPPAPPFAPPFASERQLLEWATLNARRMLDRLGGFGVAPGPIYATGGWSRSRALLELRASIFGEPVHAPEEKELSVLGAALFALAAAGGRADVETRVTIVEPRKDWQQHYADVHARFEADGASAPGREIHGHSPDAGRREVVSQFINNREDLVTEALDGLVCTSGGRLARLDGYPHSRVALRADWDFSKVALVSGGGSGHEPAHAGFVGRGMLAAAVCGDVFASPSVDAVLAGILAVTGEAGCLLVVKNYTGDRLNFGLAAERARALGRKVSMVIVDDDIALPDLPQARGLAGTLFVHKIAGAAAEAGQDLEAVTAVARRVIAGTRSIGMSLDTVTVPGSPKEARIPEGKAELGLGIHGEPGVEQVDYRGAREAIDRVAGKLRSMLGAGEHVVLLNNLGGTSVLEMGVLAYELTQSALAGQISHIVGPAAMMTSLDMRGFSVSVLSATADDLDGLAAPVDVPAWPGLASVGPLAVLPMPEGIAPGTVPASENAFARQLLTTACTALLDATADLNALDAKSGDGDTGSTLAGAARSLLDGLDALPLDDRPALCRAIGQTLSQSMGGSSGVLLAIFFSAAGEAATAGASVQDSLRAGLARMQEIGGARLGDRTMVDALAPALDALGAGLSAAAAAARAGADLTATIHRARSGRAAYVGAAQLAGHVDPGAEAVARLFEVLDRSGCVPG